MNRRKTRQEWGIGTRKSKRLVEAGHDVVIVLDSITRMARAITLLFQPREGLFPGFDPMALSRPRSFSEQPEK